MGGVVLCRNGQDGILHSLRAPMGEFPARFLCGLPKPHKGPAPWLLAHPARGRLGSPKARLELCSRLPPSSAISPDAVLLRESRLQALPGLVCRWVAGLARGCRDSRRQELSPFLTLLSPAPRVGLVGKGKAPSADPCVPGLIARLGHLQAQG